MASLLIYILPFISTVFLFFKWLYSTQPTTTKNPPPSPPKMPIIGNLHQMGPFIHRSFHSLSQRYGGPLTLLHLGSVPAVVVSSGEAASKIMNTHDLEFASKATIQTFKKLYFDFKEISAAPFDDYWKQGKKTIIVHYASTKMVQRFGEIRNQQVAETMREVEEFSVRNEVVNLTDLVFNHINSVTCRTTFGRKYDDAETVKKLKKLFMDMSDVMGRFYFADSIPQLAWIDRITRSSRRVDALAAEFDSFLEDALEERLAKMGSRSTNHELGEVEEVEPFIDALLRIQKEGSKGFSPDRIAVKGLLMDAYLGGLTTTATAIEWILAELIANPNILEKLQKEVRTVVNGRKNITDSDLEQMKYLKAVFMESARLHPPILVPSARVATQDVRVMGFDIAKGTRVYINIWAIGRDPSIWDKPEEFRPERFIGGSLDFVKHEFKFIPFGAGRRVCPGRDFSIAVIELLLANLVRRFDWRSPEEGVNMDEEIGITANKKTPLLAFATPYSG